MEILSTGEKIKKARIYKGLTLKELCEDKISVSKMSCIENDKIKPDPWILQFTSNKLQIDYDYLKKDIKDHLLENIKLIEDMSNKVDDYEEKLKYNLEYAEHYGYYQISMKLMHLLFKYYLQKHNISELEKLQCQYYSIYEKIYNEENNKIYYMDKAEYLFESKEYKQASNYYNNIKQLILKKDNKSDEDYDVLIKSMYNEISCYIMDKEYKKAYELTMDIKEYIKFIKDNLIKANLYHIMAFLSLRMKDDNFSQYEKKALELYEDKHFHKAKALNEYANIMLELGLKEEGIEYIKKGIDACPKEPKINMIRYLLTTCKTFIDNDLLDKAEEIIDEALNMAISIENLILMENAYYYKGLICVKNNNYFSGEMYMNLSLDLLMKFGDKLKIYNRYLEMGNMYFKFKNIRDALKYFNLAIKIEKYI